MKKFALIMIALSVSFTFAGCKMKGVNKGYNDALIMAASKGDLAEVKANLPSYFHEGGDINAGDDFGKTPVHRAAVKNNIEIITYLIERGADINKPDASGITPLMRAADNENIEVATLLLSKGADINAADSEGKTALKLAQYHNLAKMVEFLKSKGAKE
jgi:ankyrin repeat protein